MLERTLSRNTLALHPASREISDGTGFLQRRTLGDASLLVLRSCVPIQKSKQGLCHVGSMAEMAHSNSPSETDLTS